MTEKSAGTKVRTALFKGWEQRRAWKGDTPGCSFSFHPAGSPPPPSQPKAIVVLSRVSGHRADHLQSRIWPCSHLQALVRVISSSLTGDPIARYDKWFSSSYTWISFLTSSSEHRRENKTTQENQGICFKHAVLRVYVCACADTKKNCTRWS